MSTPFTVTLAIAMAGLLVGCVAPREQRPGMWLRGDVVEQTPLDWSFTDAHREIAIEVRTPYLLRHSVTIWCGSLDGRLYVGARAPDTKNWPGWIERNPKVRLGIAGYIYAVRLVRIDDAGEIDRIRRAYARKYDLGAPAPGAPTVRYWLVEPRS